MMTVILFHGWRRMSKHIKVYTLSPLYINRTVKKMKDPWIQKRDSTCNILAFLK